MKVTVCPSSFHLLTHTHIFPSILPTCMPMSSITSDSPFPHPCPAHLHAHVLTHILLSQGCTWWPQGEFLDCVHGNGCKYGDRTLFQAGTLRRMAAWTRSHSSSTSWMTQPSSELSHHGWHSLQQSTMHTSWRSTFRLFWWIWAPMQTQFKRSVCALKDHGHQWHFTQVSVACEEVLR